MSREALMKDQSKDRLEKIVRKKIQTTMIGALDSIEKKLGYLWKHDSEGKLTKEEQELKDVYEELRNEILDKGNNQIRIFQSELNSFEINWLRYYMNLPIK